MQNKKSYKQQQQRKFTPTYLMIQIVTDMTNNFMSRIYSLKEARIYRKTLYIIQ